MRQRDRQRERWRSQRGGRHCRMEQLEPRQMLAVNVLEPLGQLDTWEDGQDAIIDLRDVFESELDQPLVYEVQGDAHEPLVDASIEEWALRLQHAPQQSGTAEITVRAVGQLDGQQAVDTLTLNVAPVNDWPTLVEGFEALTLQEGATAVLDLTSHFADLEQEAALLNYSAAPFEVSYPGNPIASAEIEDGLLTLQATDDRFGYAKYAVRAVNSKCGRACLPPVSAYLLNVDHASSHLSWNPELGTRNPSEASKHVRQNL